MRAPAIVAVAVALVVAAVPAAAAPPKLGPNGPMSFDWQTLGPGYSWSLTGVPDIDQVRATDMAAGKQGLPNNGKMWCVPTSTMDAFAFLADQGYQTGVASKDWTLPENFNEMTAELLELGNAMGTDPQKGCCPGSQGFDAIQARLDGAGSMLAGFDGPMAIQFVSYTNDPAWTGPDAKQLALAGLDGALTFAVRGGYKQEPDPDDATKMVRRRTSGHVMAAVGAAGSYASPLATIKVRDPGTANVADSVQTPYATDSHNIGAPMTQKVIYLGGDNLDHTATTTLASWDGAANAFWEGYAKIVPVTTWVYLDGDLKRYRPYDVVPPGDPFKIRYELPGSKPVTALALSAATPSPAYLVKGSSKVRALDPSTGKSKTLARLRGARALVFGGPSQRLFVAGRRKLVALDGITGAKLDSRKLKSSLAALAFDEGSKLLVGVTRDGGKLLTFDQKLGAKGSRKLDGLSGKGRPLLAIGPKGGLVIAKTGAHSLFGAKPAAQIASAGPAAGRRALGLKRKRKLGKGIHGLAIDELGRLQIALGGKLLLLDRNGHKVERTRFRGKADAVLAVSRFFSNYNPRLLQPSIDFADFVVRPKRPDLVGRMVAVDKLRVSNVGGASAGGFTVHIDEATAAPRDVVVAGLGAGAAINITARCGTGGIATVDSGHTVAESNENNNGASLACPP